MISPVTFTQQDRIGILRIDNPPVNAISPQTVEALVVGFDRFEEARDLAALVICCAGRTFVAGGDIVWFERSDFSQVADGAELVDFDAAE